ncbi:MAG: diguanylate cyclase domain-containing protein, partial [bacterium]
RKSFLATFETFAKRREHENYALFLADIDYFKKINDTYGHATGDAALQTLSKHIRDMVTRHNGFAGRWGGDEFIGVLPLSGEAARAALSDMCREVRETCIEGDVHITISAGVAMGQPNSSIERLSEMADQALYASKALGKDQASLFDGSDMPEIQAEATVKATQREKSPEPMAASVAAEERLSVGDRLRRFIHNLLIPSTLLGVRWMAPFVAGGGILIGLAFLFDAASVNLSTLSVAQRAEFGSITQVAAMLKGIGGNTFDFMLPVFAGFMAYGLAGENAFMAGFIGGFITIDSQSGFI